MGTKSPAKICRHERFVQLPGLATALAYEVIFQTPARELFGGLYAQTERGVVARAKRLIQKLAEETTGNTPHRKLDTLKAIIDLTTPWAGEKA